MFGFGKKKQTILLHVGGMSCEQCVRRVKEALESLKGVKASVDLAAGTAEITCPEGITAETLIKTIEDAGYSASH